jgi:ribosomal protein L14E/L6E/L27E
MSESGSSYKVGEIVQVIQGRDTGKYAVILEIINERYVRIIDGDRRKYDNPKKKNVIHIRSTGVISKEVITSLVEEKRVSNAKVRYVLQEFVNGLAVLEEEKGESVDE